MAPASHRDAIRDPHTHPESCGDQEPQHYREAVLTQIQGPDAPSSTLDAPRLDWRPPDAPFSTRLPRRAFLDGASFHEKPVYVARCLPAVR